MAIACPTVALSAGVEMPVLGFGTYKVGATPASGGVPREELFLISKVWGDNVYKGKEAVKEQCQKTIADLECKYLDCYLVHWPTPGKHVEAYQALRELKAEGLVKSIGISNYTIEDYEELAKAGFGENDADKPVMNQ